MKENILQTFLNKQFIKTTETANIESLKKAVTAVKKLLLVKKNLLIPYTLVAFDPQIKETDLVVSEVENLIIKNWPTFKNSTSTKDKATTYVRVVILEALSEMAENEQSGAIIWLTGRNVISYYKLQKEQEPLSELLIEIGSLFEHNARKYWEISKPTIKNIQELSVELPVVQSSKVSAKALTTNLYKATIYSGWAVQAGVPGENVSYASNGNWEWEKSFSEKAGVAIAELINSAVTIQDQTLSEISKVFQNAVNEYFDQFTDFFTGASFAVNQSAEATNRRGNLLWWKESLYSPSLNISYRNQPEMKSAMAVAYDLSNLVGLMYPESVNYLLRETLRDIYGDNIDKVETFNSWIQKAQEETESGKLILKDLLDNLPNRKSLSTALANMLQNNTVNNLAEETGIDPTQEISLSDLTVWIFHDLQAKKISSQK